MESKTPEQWIVLYLFGGRIASFPLEQKDELKKYFHYTLIQVDVTGTEHWEVLGLIRPGLNGLQKMRSK